MRLLSIVRYVFVPLHVSSLLSILYFAIALTIGEHAGVAGIFIFLGAGLLFFCYGFALLDHLLEGHSYTLVLSTDVISTFAKRAIGTLALVVLFYVATERLEQWIGPFLTLILRLALLALFPVFVAGTIMTGRFLGALNPVAAFGTIARIPDGYIALVLVIAAIWAVPLWMFHESTFSFSSLWRMETFLPTGLFRQIGLRGLFIGLLGHIVALYSWLATFACIGGTFYEWRWELDIKAADAPERDEERAAAELEQQHNKLMDELHTQMRIGAFTRARESVRKMIAESPQPVDECRWLYARTSKFTDQRLPDYLAQLLLPLLFKQKATGEALEITRQRLAASRDFRPQTSAQLLQLVELARAAGDRATARLLLADFSRHYAGDPLIERVTQLQSDLQR
jgi:hypothetical protein